MNAIDYLRAAENALIQAIGECGQQPQDVFSRVIQARQMVTKILDDIDGVEAQPDEQSACTGQVAGSTPVGSTILTDADVLADTIGQIRIGIELAMDGQLSAAQKASFVTSLQYCDWAAKQVKELSSRNTEQDVVQPKEHRASSVEVVGNNPTIPTTPERAITDPIISICGEVMAAFDGPDILLPFTRYGIEAQEIDRLREWFRDHGCDNEPRIVRPRITSIHATTRIPKLRNRVRGASALRAMQGKE